MNNEKEQPPPEPELPPSYRRWRETATFKEKMLAMTYMYVIKGMLAPAIILRDWTEWISPPQSAPTLIKTYPCRPSLPVR